MSITAGKHGRSQHRTSFPHLARLSVIASLALTVIATLAGAAHAQTPVAAYSFDEGSGEAAKDSAGDHDGTIEGASWVSSGKYGSALEFDGENDLVSIADAADLDLTGSFTLEAWVRPDSFSAARPVISKVGFPEAGAGGYQLEGTSAGMPLGRVAVSGAVKGVEGTEALSTEEAWSHVALTSDESTLRLYVNGVLVKSGDGPTTADTGAALKIGNGFGGWFDGLIDEVRIYDQALSESAIQIDRDNRVLTPVATEVLTTQADTGESSELVQSIPISSEGTETVVYSLPLPAPKAGEILRALGTVEVTNTHGYNVTDSVRLVLGATETAPTGTAITPWSSIDHTPEMYHWTLPFNGIYRLPADATSTQYLKVVLKAASLNTEAGDTLIVHPNFGRLAATRYTPVTNVLAQPTHAAQAYWDDIPEQITSVPVNSGWQRVQTRQVSSPDPPITT